MDEGRIPRELLAVRPSVFSGAIRVNRAGYERTMEQETFNWLRSAEGQTLLADLAQREFDERRVLAELTRLRAQYAPEYARAAIEQVLLRRRARTKFPHADQLFFTREALEQASSASVAAHRAQRLARYASVIADLGCGIGGDTLALATAGLHVIAVDHDAARLAIAAANAAAIGLADRITTCLADLRTTPPPSAEAFFCDPGRRGGGRRRFRVEQYEPPLSHVLCWRDLAPTLTVKLAPGVDHAELADVQNAELEFVSLNGELKEAVLWIGPPATMPRRATVLSSQSAEATAVHCLTGDDLDSPPIPQSTPLDYLYEPDPAVIRAGIIAELASQWDAAQIDPQIAYLTTAVVQYSPFARVWRVLEWFPFNLKRLRSRLRALDAGEVTVKKRGSPLDTDALARQLSGAGTQSLVVVLSQVAGRPTALICKRHIADE